VDNWSAGSRIGTTKISMHDTSTRICATKNTPHLLLRISLFKSSSQLKLWAIGVLARAHISSLFYFV
jgi:hypothetical protein